LKASAVIAPACSHNYRRKYWKNRKGQQRYQCAACHAVFTEEPPNPLGDMRIDRDRAEKILHMLVEGCSASAAARLTGTDIHTVLDLMVLVGERCHRFMDRTFQGLTVRNVEVDEVWQFIGCKDKTAKQRLYPDEFGDSYLFTAIERGSKLLFAYQLSKRTSEEAEHFCWQIAQRTIGRFALATDGFRPYFAAVYYSGMAGRVDYGQVVKNYGNVSKDDARKYSPAKIISCERKAVLGDPTRKDISTSIVERSNLSLRTFARRMSRLTCAFSRKWQNHAAAMALAICHYNFCRVHRTLQDDAGRRARARIRALDNRPIARQDINSLITNDRAGR
jgi:transposase-like protein/IS1 family transposase